MRVILFLMSLGAGCFGALIFLASESAIHEIEAFILFLIAAVFIGSAAICDAVIIARNQIVDAIEEASEKRSKKAAGEDSPGNPFS